ncbi:MAG: hypothetical protein AAB276_05390 [Pseudomonadota bacterium]
MTKENGALDIEASYANTVKGNAMAQASFLPSITRTKAQAIVAALIARAQQVNQDPYYFHCVSAIQVFGSYITNAPMLNDIDIIPTIGWKSRFRDDKIKNELSQARSHLACRNGRQFSNIVENIYWPQTEVLLFLRARSPRINFHEADEIAGLNISCVDLYRLGDE